MGLGLRDLEIGCVYAKGNAAKELYLYLSKTRGRNSRYYSDIKEGNTFLYIGREWEFNPKSVCYEKLTKETIIDRAKSMLSWELGEDFSIIKGNKNLSHKFTDIKLTDAEINMLCFYGNLTRINKTKG